MNLTFMVLDVIVSISKDLWHHSHFLTTLVILEFIQLAFWRGVGPFEVHLPLHLEGELFLFFQNVSVPESFVFFHWKPDRVVIFMA